MAPRTILAMCETDIILSKSFVIHSIIHSYSVALFQLGYIGASQQGARVPRLGSSGVHGAPAGSRKNSRSGSERSGPTSPVESLHRRGSVQDELPVRAELLALGLIRCVAHRNKGSVVNIAAPFDGATLRTGGSASDRTSCRPQICPYQSGCCFGPRWATLIS